MRIIIVSPRIPYPLNDGARIRTYSIIKQVARRHVVTLFTFVSTEEEAAYVDVLKQICSDVRYVRLVRPPWRRLLQIIMAPVRNNPFLVTVFASWRLQRLIADYEYTPDIAIAEFPPAGQYIRTLSCKKVLDAHNVESDVLLRQSMYENNIFKKLFFYFQVKKMQKYEAEMCRSMDMVLATSKDDQKKLNAYNRRTYVVPNAINIDSYGERVPEQELVLVFVGLMSYLANVDAITYFLDEIWPLIKREEPACRFWIVGKDPPAELRDLNEPDIVVTGTVAQVEPYVRAASVFVVPLRIGSGTRLKILEAMACLKPVVSTSLGCMGLDVHDGRDIYIADSPELFAHRVVSLLRDAEARRKIGERGRQLVADRYTWDHVGQSLERIFVHDVCDHSNSKELEYSHP